MSILPAGQITNISQTGIRQEEIVDRSLTTKMLTKRPVVGQLGDSLTNNGHNFGPWVWQLGSIVMQAAKYSNYAFIAGPGRGYPGYKIDEVYAVMDSAEPMTDPNTTHILVLLGTNNPAQTVQTNITSLRRVYDKILRAGKIPIACTIPPRTSTDATSVFNIVQLNNAIPKLAAEYGIPCADIFEPLNTWSATSGAMAVNTTYYLPSDTIHFNGLGVQTIIAPIVAKAILPLLGSSAAQVYPPLRSRLQCANSSGAPTANTLFRTITGTINQAGSVAGAPWTATLSPTHIVQDQANGPAEVAAYGQSNIWTITLNPANDATVIDPSTNNGTIDTEITPEAGDLIGCCINFKYVPGSADTAGTGGFEIGLRDVDAKTTRLMSYGQIMTSSTDVVSADSGYIYMERLLPSTFKSGKLTWYITLNQAAASTGAALSLSNSWVVNWTKMGVV